MMDTSAVEQAGPSVVQGACRASDATMATDHNSLKQSLAKLIVQKKMQLIKAFV